MKLPDLEGVGNDDHAVDLGGFAVTPTDSWLIHEHSDLRTHEKVTFCAGDVVLKFPELCEPLIAKASINLAVELHRVGAGLGRVGEEAAPVELGLFDEVEERIVIDPGVPRLRAPQFVIE